MILHDMYGLFIVIFFGTACGDMLAWIIVSAITMSSKKGKEEDKPT